MFGKIESPLSYVIEPGNIYLSPTTKTIVVLLGKNEKK